MNVIDNEIQTIEKKKHFLSRYKRNLCCVNRLEEKLSLLEFKISTIKSPNASNIPAVKNGITKEELIYEKMEVEERLKNLKIKGNNLRSEILSEIDKLEDAKHVEVMECVFIKCLNLDETADFLCYGKRHVLRIYGEALKELTQRNES